MALEEGKEVIKEAYRDSEGQQPSEDAISREETRRILANQRDELVKLHTVNPKDNPQAFAMAHGVNWSLNTLMNLPSVTPQQKVGKWIFHKPFDDGCKNCNECIECSQCHIWLGYDCYAKTLYCPNCGAKMESEEDGL